MKIPNRDNENVVSVYYLINKFEPLVDRISIPEK